MRAKILTARDFATAKAFQDALFDEPVIEYLHRNQNILFAVDLVENRNRLPPAMDVQVGQSQALQRGVPPERLPSLVKRRVGFGERFFMAAPGGLAGAGRQSEVLAVAIQVMRMLKAKAPPSSPDPKNHRYRYREGFRYLIGGVATPQPPIVGGDWTAIGITNVAPHAATMENPTWPRPFTKTWARVMTLAAKERLDAQFRWISGGSLPLLRKDYYNEARGYRVRDWTPWGVYLRSSDYGHRRDVRYSVPVFWIGPLNSLKGPDRIRHRHRTNRRRLDRRRR